MVVYISPNHTAEEYSNPWTIEDKIEVFRDRVQGWQLGVAKAMIEKSIPHCQIAVLYITTSYFEMIAKYKDGYTGNKNPGKFFKKGIHDVFPGIEPAAEDFVNSLYINLRCGLYHVGFPKPNVILHHPLPQPIGYKSDIDFIVVDPPLLLENIQSHFDQYINNLRDNHNKILRENFEKKFNAEISN